MGSESVGQVIKFSEDRPGELPQGWQGGRTGSGCERWEIATDATADGGPNVLKQTGAAKFAWCVRRDIALSDGQVEVKFKPIAGREDQAGGIVWRWKDGDNYYVARANALEDNVSLYYTVKGQRITLKYVDAPVRANTWHTLRVEFRAESIRVVLNGKLYIEAQDSHIAGPGSAGVWTKADSVTAFDAFSWRPLAE